MTLTETSASESKLNKVLGIAISIGMLVLIIVFIAVLLKQNKRDTELSTSLLKKLAEKPTYQHHDN